MKKLVTILLGVGLVLSLLSFGSAVLAQRATSFRVVVHPDNPVRSLSRAEVSNMFLRRERRWPNGSSVDPVDQPVSSHVRDDFSEAVHRRSATSVASYWRQQIFSGRSVPPSEKQNDAQVVRYVATHPDAIGYVSASADTSAVRVLDVTGL